MHFKDDITTERNKNFTSNITLFLGFSEESGSTLDSFSNLFYVV